MQGMGNDKVSMDWNPVVVVVVVVVDVCVSVVHLRFYAAFYCGVPVCLNLVGRPPYPGA